MTFYEKVIGLCNQKGISPSALATAIGQTRAAASGWRTSIPRSTTIKKLADYFGVPVSYFTEEETTKLAPNIYSVDGIINMSVIGTIKAGYGGVAAEIPTGETSPIPLEFLRGQPRDEFFLLRVRGNSMYPRVLEGDLVLCRRCDTVEDGAVAVVLYNGDEATLKKVHYEIGKNWVELQPCNPEYAPMRVCGNDLDNLRILGRVVKSIRDF